MFVVHSLLMVLSLSGTASDPASNDLDGAHGVYVERYAQSPEGVYPREGLLFVVVEIRQADTLAEDVLQARSMLRSSSLLRQFARENLSAKPCRGEGTVLLEKYPLVLQECRSVEPDFGEPAFHFRIKSRLMEEAKTGKVYRYAIALDRGEFQRQIPASFAQPPSMGEIAACLNRRLMQLKRDDARELAAVWLRLGCVEETLRVANDSSGRSYELASYAFPAEDTLELYAGWQAASRALSSGKAEAKDMAAVLARAPGFPPALRWLADDYAGSKRFAAAANLRLLSLIDGDEPAKNVRQFGELLQSWGRSALPAAPVLDEYRRLIDALAKEEMPSLGHEAAKSARTMARVWRTFGHVNFPNSDARTANGKTPSPATPVEQTDPFATQGAEAIAENPRLASAWVGIAQAVLAEKRPLAAVPFLAQAVRLDPTDNEARMMLASCYQKLGYVRLSRGAALAALVCLGNPDKHQAARDACLNLLDVSPTGTSTGGTEKNHANR